MKTLAKPFKRLVEEKRWEEWLWVIFYMLLINTCMCYVIEGSGSRKELNTSQIIYHLSHINHFPKHPQHNRKATVGRGQMFPTDLETTRMHFVLEKDSARTSIPWCRHQIQLSLCFIKDIYLFLNVHWQQCLTPSLQHWSECDMRRQPALLSYVEKLSLF